MKIRTILIAAGITGGVIAGIGFGARAVVKQSVKPVQVTPVYNVQTDVSWFMDDSSISGTIISSDTQNIDLLQEEGVYLKEVYVSVGDTVKKGDRLLEYDMTLIELQRELEDLNRQVLELNLQSAEKNLETLLKNPGGAAAMAILDTGEEDDDDFTASADTLIEEEDPVDSGQTAGDPLITEKEEAAGGAADDEENDLFDGDTAGGNPSSENVPTQTQDVVQAEENVDVTYDEEGFDDEIFDDYDEGDDPDDFFQEDDGADAQDTSLIADDLPAEGDEAPGGEDGSDDDSDYMGKKSPIEKLIDVEDPERASMEVLPEEVEDINEDALTFIRRVNTMTGKDTATEQIAKDYMDETFAMFEEKLAQLTTDSTEQQRHYVLKPEVVQAFQAKGSYYSTDTFDYPTAMQVSLFRAYGNLNLFRLRKLMDALENDLKGIDVTNAEQMAALKPQVTEASEAYQKFASVIPGMQAELTMLGEDLSAEALVEIYESYLTAYGGENMVLEDTAQGSLSRIVGWLGGAEEELLEAASEALIPFVEDPEAAEDMSEEPFSEDFDWDDYDDWGDDWDEGYGYSQEELEEEIRAIKSEIDEYNLQLRETDLKIRQFDRILEKRVITASMDGIVKNAGETSSDSYDQYFIVVAGQSGMYVQGRVNELSRDTIKIGDTLSGTSFENDEPFTATVTEISEYPSTGEDDFFGWGFSSENPTASYYPFTAYIENAENIVEGYAEMSFDTEHTETTGIYLEKFFILTDLTGRDYVMIRGEDGLLKKQYVQTGKSYWNSYIEIVSGLNGSDLIALPYGENVEEGAKTEEVESLEY